MKHPKQYLFAALALALMLGIASPSLTFAAEDNNVASGVAVVASDSATAITTLYNRIGTRSAFASFRKDRNLILTSLAAEILTTKFKDLEDAQDYLKDLDAEQRAEAEEMTIIDLINEAKNSPEYTESEIVRTSVDALDEVVNQIITQFHSEIDAVFAPEGGSASMTIAEMITMTKTLPDYDKEAALVNAMTFLFETTEASDEWQTSFDGLSFDAQKLNATFAPHKLYEHYTAMAEAATALDASVTEGFNVPEPPADPVVDPDPDPDPDDSNQGEQKPTQPAVPDELPSASAPNTGITNLFENGASDTAKVTIIAASSLAALVGVGLIAKLYLKRRF